MEHDRQLNDLRTWAIWQEEYAAGTCKASSAQDALAKAREDVELTDYGAFRETIWVDISVHCELTGESASGRVQLDPKEPPCSHADGHDWQAPQEIVGGCDSNPGVRGNGGGVIITKVCMRCGCSRRTDTWSQHPEVVAHGYTTISYEPAGEFAEDLEGS